MNNRLGLEGPRIIAAVIDGIACGLLYNIIHAVLHGWFGGVLAVVAVLGYMYIEVLNGASPGKKIMGVTVANATGGAPGQDTLLRRYLYKNAAWLIMLVAAVIAIIPILGTIVAILLWFVAAVVGLGLGLGSLYKVMQPDKQTIWDQMANTAVVGGVASSVGGSYPPSAPPAQFPGPDVSPTAPPPPPSPPVTSAPEV